MPTSKIDAQKAEFLAREERKISATVSLVEAVAQSSNQCLVFYEALQPLSHELKRLTYTVGIQFSDGFNRALILSVLSKESTTFAQDVLSSIHPTPMTRMLSRFLNGWRYRIPKPGANDAEGQASILRNSEVTDTLEGVADSSLLSIDQIAEVAERAGQTSTLSKSVNASLRLFDALPTGAFPDVLRQVLAVFVCTADPNIGEVARLLPEVALVGQETTIAEVVRRFDRSQLRSLLDAYGRASTVSHPVILASVLDVMRQADSEYLRQKGTLLSRLSKNRAPYLRAMSVVAEFEVGQRRNPKMLTEAITRALKSSAVETIATWIAQNPSYAEGLPVSSLPFSKWRTLIQVAAELKSRALWTLVRDASQMFDGPEGERYWQEAIVASAEMGGDARTVNTVGQLVKAAINRGWQQQVASVSSKHPVRELIEDHFWEASAVLERGVAQALQLFPWLTSGRILTLLRTESDKGALGETALSKALISLLRNATFEPAAWKTIGDLQFLKTIASILADVTTEIVTWLSDYPGNWAHQRELLKQKIFERVSIGLHTAVRNTPENERLQSQIVECTRVIQSWRDSSFGVTAVPPLQVNVSRFESAAVNEEDRLRRAIQNASQNRQAFAVFFCENRWSWDVLLSGADPSLPRPAEVIQTVFEGVRSLETARERGVEALNGLNAALLIELSVELRAQLAAIENELAGYFMFRDALAEVGIESVETSLGRVIRKSELSSETHQFLRDKVAAGRERNITLGLRVGQKFVGSVDVINSGEPDDRD